MKIIEDLCNHCNLQKRQICNIEKKNEKLYSAKNIERYKIYPFEFPWEKKAFDINDISCTYWFDLIEFDKNIYYYSIYIIPIINEIKNKIKYQINCIALLKYSVDNSQPLNFLFVFLQAKAVVPLPKNVSNTISFSLECFLINSSNKHKLFCVG